MERSEHDVAAVEQGDELSARQLGQLRHRFEVGVDRSRRRSARVGQRRAEPTDAPRTAQAAQRRARGSASGGACASA